MNHLNKDIIFGIRKSKLGVFSVVIAIMGACFLTGKSVAADQVGEQAQVQTQGQEATTSDPAKFSSRYQPIWSIYALHPL